MRDRAGGMRQRVAAAGIIAVSAIVAAVAVAVAVVVAPAFVTSTSAGADAVDTHLIITTTTTTTIARTSPLVSLHAARAGARQVPEYPADELLQARPQLLGFDAVGGRERLLRAVAALELVQQRPRLHYLSHGGGGGSGGGGGGGGGSGGGRGVQSRWRRRRKRW